MRTRFSERFVVFGLFFFIAFAAHAQKGAAYQVFVSNEKSGDLTVIYGATLKVTATIHAGKRPRGVPGSPDGKLLYVALSGTPIEPPPELDANGNPILKKNQKEDDDDDKAKSDKSPDGIGIVDAVRLKFL